MKTHIILCGFFVLLNFFIYICTMEKKYNLFVSDYVVDKNSILNSFPLENIK